MSLNNDQLTALEARGRAAAHSQYHSRLNKGDVEHWAVDKAETRGEQRVRGDLVEAGEDPASYEVLVQARKTMKAGPTARFVVIVREKDAIERLADVGEDV